MTFVQATTGSGGWPMSVLLTPELQAVLRRHVFPARQSLRTARVSGVMLRAHRAKPGSNDRERIVESSARRDRSNWSSMRGDRPAHAPVLAGRDVLDSGFQHFRRTFDSRTADSAMRRSFPRPVVLNFLLRYYVATPANQEALDMALATLRAMAKGGMHDQLGGGFHRYSVDERWFVPHFEKMLYDQAQLAISYLEAFQITRDPFYADSRAQHARLRAARHDASGRRLLFGRGCRQRDRSRASQGEGRRRVLHLDARGDRSSRWAKLTPDFCYRYGVEPDGNVDERSAWRVHRQEHSVSGANPETDATEAELQRGQARDFACDAARSASGPHLDDKILTAWNGLMISAFAKGVRRSWTSRATSKPRSGRPTSF